jgi:hypothetical protein
MGSLAIIGELEKVRALVWGACGARMPATYKAPWRGIAEEAWAELTAALGDKKVLAAARTAVTKPSDMVKKLLRSAPAVHRIAMNLRGLVLSAGTAVAPPATPGVPLVYEEIATY